MPDAEDQLANLQNDSGTSWFLDVPGRSMTNSLAMLHNASTVRRAKQHDDFHAKTPRMGMRENKRGFA